MDKKKVCFITAIPSTANVFLRSHMEALSKSYSVHYVCNSPDPSAVEVECEEFYNVGIERGFSVFKDIKALFKLYRYFRKEIFAAVHSVTPKAGLLTALAGWMAAVPVRIHIFTGQVWATRKGFKRWLLKSLDKLIVRLDNHILTDGKSQRAFLEKEGVLKEGQATVFGQGSFRGVDTQKFAPNADARKETRAELNIKDDTLVFLYMGRLNHDKGIGELFQAYDRLASETKNVFLLMVGEDEENYMARVPQYPHINEANCLYHNFTTEPERFYNAGDVFVFPTYREGFPNSVLEAASAGLPAITTDAYGVLDAVAEGETGLRCKVADAQGLYDLMKYFNDHRNLVKTMGEKGRERVVRDFSGDRLTECWVEYYHSLLGE